MLHIVNDGSELKTSQSTDDDVLTTSESRASSPNRIRALLDAPWIRRHRVILAATALIVVQLTWKASFLNGLYFRQNDFQDLDLAITHHLDWNYLSYASSGRLVVGLRVIAWFLVRISPGYDWGVASVISLAFVAATSVAAFLLLRDMFGERWIILLPLTIYVLDPLNIPNLGVWSSAMESEPLQLAIFMALRSHLRYVRTNAKRNILYSAAWIAIGALCFEKGVFLPLLLFAITAAFVVARPTLLNAVTYSLIRFWRAWVSYAIIAIGYLILLANSVAFATIRPQWPTSARPVLMFSWDLLRETFVPGAIGGPWQWYPATDHSYSLSSPPPLLILISAVVAVCVIVTSVWLKRSTWRAWAILAGWIVLADALPVIATEVNIFPPGLLALETRDLADAMPVFAICLALAFLPIRSDLLPERAQHRPQTTDRQAAQSLRAAAACLLGVFIVGSIWSVQAYENVTTGYVAGSYIAAASASLSLVKHRTTVIDERVPGDIVEELFGRYSLQSSVLGDLDHSRNRPTLIWTMRPTGTIDGLTMFAPDGSLRPVQVQGASSPVPSTKCWPQEDGQIAVHFFRYSPPYSRVLQVAYIWGSRRPGFVEVKYGNFIQALAVLPGLHTGYLPVTGSTNSITISDLGRNHICISNAAAGFFAPVGG
jgi:hypothetical protein